MRKKIMILFISISLALLCLILFVTTQIFATSYYKDGILHGKLSKAYEASKYVFGLSGLFITALSIFSAYYLFINHKYLGIHKRQGFILFKSTVIGILFYTIFFITALAASSLNIWTIFSWLSFATAAWQVIIYGKFSFVIYRT